MRSSVPALLWEQWRLTRWLMLLLLAIALSLHQLMWTLGHARLLRTTDLGVVGDALVLASLGLCMVFFALSFNDPKDLRLGFPRRLYRLPVSTVSLVSWGLLGRLAIATVQFAALFAIHHVYFGGFTRLSYAPAMLGFLSLFLCLLAIVWATGGYSGKAGVAAVVLFLALLALCGPAAAEAFQRVGIVAFATCAAGAFVVAWAGVALDRAGTWQGAPGPRGVLSWILFPPGQRLRALLDWAFRPLRVGGRAFPSPTQAQVWLESRRTGLLLPALTVIFCLGAFFLLPFSLGVDPRDLPPRTAPRVLLLALGAAGFVAGIVTALLDQRDQTSGMAAFLTSRPLSSTGLAKARLKAAALSVARTFLMGVVLLVCSLWVSQFFSRQDLLFSIMKGAHPADVAGAALLVVAAVLAVWTLLWCGASLLLALFALTFIPFYVGVVLFDEARSGPLYVKLVNAYPWYVCTVLLLGTAWAFVTARRQRLLSNQALVTALAVWCAGVACFLLLGLTLFGSLPTSVLTVGVGLAAMPLMPFATVPLGIHRRRSGGGRAVPVNAASGPLITPRVRRWIVLVAALLLTTYASWRVLLYTSTARQLRAVAAQGYPATLDDLNQWYPAVPAGENAAGLYLAAFKTAAERDGKWDALPLVGIEDLPHRAAPLPEEMKVLMAECLEAHAAALALLHEAAARPRCRYPINLAVGADTPMHHLGQLRRAAELLALQAIASSEQGDSDQATRALVSGLAPARSLTAEPIILSQMVRSALIGEWAEVFEQVLNRVDLSTEQLGQIDATLDGMDAMGGMKRAVVAARCQVSSGFGCTNAVWAPVCLTPEQQEAYVKTREARLKGALYRWSGIRALDHRLFLAQMQRLIAQTGYAGSQCRARAIEEEVLALPAWCAPWTRALVPAMARVFEAEARGVAWVRVARTAIAVERYRLTTGHVPNDLVALQPARGDWTFSDPFRGSGPTMRYRQFPGGYIVYSIDINGRDDGGCRERDLVLMVGGDLETDRTMELERRGKGAPRATGLLFGRPLGAGRASRRPQGS